MMTKVGHRRSSFIIPHSSFGFTTSEPNIDERSERNARERGAFLRKLIVGGVAWLVVITGLHMLLNVNWQVLMNDRLPESKRKLNVAYIPVT